MYSEIDYLVQKERHQDHIAEAERYRRGEGNLPTKGPRLADLKRKIEELLTAATGWDRTFKTPSTTLGKTNA